LGNTSIPAIPRLTDRSTATTFDQISIQPPRRASYHVGDSLLVVRIDRDIAGWGGVVVPVGVARVTELQRRQVLADVIMQFGRIHDGHLALPLEPFKDPGEVHPTPVDRGLEGAGAVRPVVLVPHLIALGLYALAAALALAPFAGLRPAPRALALGLPLLGIATHVIGVARLSSFLGVAPTLSMLALFLMALQVASEGLFRASAVGLFTGPLATGLLGLALLIGLAPETPAASTRGAWSILHITVSVLGLAMLALAFIAAALYLLQFRELKAKRFGPVFRLFPPLERLDQLNHLSLVLGF